MIKALLPHVDPPGGGRQPHVNQTKYGSLQESLIAVSIETKSEWPKSNPLIQLGIWVAAWHQRMYELRHVLAGVLLRKRAPGSMPQLGGMPPLVTLPLIQIVGHEWVLRFACDEGDRVILWTGVEIGSTEEPIKLYALLGALAVLKDWALDQFRKKMETWFACGMEL